MPLLQNNLIAELEAEVRTEADLQIVLSSVGEVDLIANFQTQSNWSQESLNTAAGIHGELGVSVGNSADLVSECTRRQVGRMGEVNESKLARYEYAERPCGARLEFWSK